MNNYTFQLDAGVKTRFKVGSYDPISYLPKYDIEVITPHEEAKRKIEINPIIMGMEGSHFLVWEIKNDSAWPVYFNVKKDGVLVER